MRLTSVFCALIYSVTCLAQVDTQTLEEVLNGTFSEVVEYFDFIESGAITIDHDYTDVDAGRVKISANATSTPLDSNSNAAGEPEPLVISASIVTDLTDTDDERKLFALVANAGIQGNTVKVFKSVAEVYGECTQTPIDEDTTDSIHNNNILCFIFDGFREAEKVVDLQESFQAAANYARQHYGSDTETDSIVGDIFSSLAIAEDGEDLVLSFKIETEDSSFLKDVSDNLTADVTLRIKETGIYLDANASAIFEIRQVDDVIEKVKKLAEELQDRNSETHTAYYEDNMYLLFEVIGAFLVPEVDEED